jgi:hypothetical protein
MNTDTLNRRLRFAAPNPLVRRLQLVDADILAFEAINRHGPLPSHYLYEFTKHVRRDKTHLVNLRIPLIVGAHSTRWWAPFPRERGRSGG